MKNQNTFQAYLSFKLGAEMFAVSVHHVLEVLEKQIITCMPNSPAHISGVINFRGEIVPVIKTREKFKLPYLQENDNFVIIILEINSASEKLVVGAMVDSVKDVLEISTNEIQAVPSLGSNYSTEFLHGMVKVEDKFIMLLNVEKIFTQDEVNILVETAEETNQP